MNIKKIYPFLIDFLQEQILQQWCNNFTLYTMREGRLTRHKSELSIQFNEVDAEETMLAFKLSGVAMWDIVSCETVKYELTGLVSCLNGGRIVISFYNEL